MCCALLSPTISSPTPARAFPHFPPAPPAHPRRRCHTARPLRQPRHIRDASTTPGVAHRQQANIMTDEQNEAAIQAPDDHREQAKVLVVEDDADIRKILELFLSEKGFHVKAAENGPRALDMLGEEPVDLILSDVRMPGMTGLEFLRIVKERDPEIQLVL